MAKSHVLDWGPIRLVPSFVTMDERIQICSEGGKRGEGWDGRFLESTLLVDHYANPGWAGRTAADIADRFGTEMGWQTHHEESRRGNSEYLPVHRRRCRGAGLPTH